MTAIGRALGLPKSSAHRLLAALGRRGLVESDERGRYRPGIGLVALGLGALESEPIVVAARPVLEDAAQALGETFFLVAARAGRLVVLDKAEGTGFLRAAPRVGSSVPVHATAVGKLFLAFGGDAISRASRALRAVLREHAAPSPTSSPRRSSGPAGGGSPRIARSGFRGSRCSRRRCSRATACWPRWRWRRPSQHFLALGAEAIAQRALAAAERIAARLEGTGR